MGYLIIINCFLIFVSMLLLLRKRKLIIDGKNRGLLFFGLAMQFLGLLVANIIQANNYVVSDSVEVLGVIDINYGFIFTIAFYMSPIGMAIVYFSIISSLLKE